MTMSRNRTLIHVARSLMAVTLALVLVLGSDPALAWGRKKAKKPVKKPTHAVNLDKHPSMQVYRGVLHKDIYGAWTLDKHPLTLNRNSRITNTPGSNGGTEMIEGREAKVTAANIGGTLVVYRVTMLTSNEMMERGAYNVSTSEEPPKAMDPGSPK